MEDAEGCHKEGRSGGSTMEGSCGMVIEGERGTDVGGKRGLHLCAGGALLGMSAGDYQGRAHRGYRV
jgi:hypothetical protein